MRKILLASLFAAAGFATAAESELESIKQLTGDAAKGYMAPLTSAIGSDLNLGYFNHAPKPDLWGIDLQAGIILVGSTFTDTKTFSAEGTFALSSAMARDLAKQMTAAQGVTDTSIQQKVADQLKGKNVTVRFAGPTSVGSSSEKVKATVTSNAVATVGGNTFEAKGYSSETKLSGIDLPSFFIGAPLLYPQINLGTVAGTQVAFRGFPGSLDLGSMGEVSFWGLGISHNPGFWNDKENYIPLGINSSVTATYTKFEIGKSFSWTGWSVGLLASKRLGLRFLNVTPYAGLGMESSTLELNYSYDPEVPGVAPVAFSIEQDGDSFLYLTGGLGLRLGVFNFDLGGRYSANPGGNLGINLAF